MRLPGWECISYLGTRITENKVFSAVACFHSCREEMPLGFKVEIMWINKNLNIPTIEAFSINVCSRTLAQDTLLLSLR